MAQWGTLADANRSAEGYQEALNRKNAFMLAMRQEVGEERRRLSESVVVLLAASEGYLDAVVERGDLAGTEAGRRVMTELLEHIRKNAADSMREIDETLDIAPKV